MDKKTIGITILFWVFVLGFFMVVMPSMESVAEHNFNKTLEAVKENTELTFSKTNMTGSERTHYIENTCEIVFGNGNYRDNDVELCKTKMGLK